MTFPDLLDIKEQARSLESVAGYTTSSLTLTGMGEAEIVSGARVTDGLLDVFRMAPSFGRDIRAEENVPAGPRVAVIGHAFWQERFGGTRDVLGKTLELSGNTYEIVGVAPEGFEYPNDAQIWVPRYHQLDGCGRGCHVLRVVGRLADGTTTAGALQELESLALALEAAYPKENTGKRFNVLTLNEATYGDVKTGLFVLLGAVGIVLLIACANVANLLLVRASSRTGEIAVRSALGAGRGRIITQLLMEAFVLASLGGIAGLVLARGGVALLVRIAPSNLPRLDEVHLDGTVLVFTMGTVAMVTLLFGLAPARRLARVDVAQALTHGGRGGHGSRHQNWSRGALLASEVALSVMLLFGAGLLLRSFSELRAVDLGFEKQDVLTFTMSLPEARYGPDAAVRFFETLEDRLRALPQVEAVGAAFGSAMGRGNITGSFELLDRPPPPVGQDESALVRYVTPGYFDAIKVSVLRGRRLEASDRIDTPPVALISQSMAQRYYPDSDPIGKTFDLHVSVGYANPDEPRTIVGIVSDFRSRRLTSEPQPEIYISQGQGGSPYLTVLVRTLPGATDILASARREVRALDPNVPLRSIEMLEETVSRSYGSAQFHLTLLTVFAGVAVVLSAIGLYGVVAYLVAQRRREIGLRMALGAQGRDVLRLVMIQGGRPALIGIVAGLAGALAGGRILESLVYNVTPHDVPTFIGVTVLLGVVVLIATLVPATRATRVAPVTALKGE